jgi:tetratricopeptide (TPR) repeat protein
MRWDIWLERATGRTSLRQFSVFRKPRHEVYCSLASRYHHDALRASESGDFKGALSILAEGDGACRMALELEEAMHADRQAHTAEEDIFEEAADITASYEILVSTCTATRALESGHGRFAAAVADSAEKLMDYALLALDNYRHALSCATSKDIELEAESVYYVAKTYQILLKNETKAHELYLRAISLVTTLSPKLPGGTWFTEAKKAVEARRAKLKAQEDSEWHTRRGPIYEKVKDKVEEIHKKSDEDARQLVEWLMKTYPPKTEGDAPDLTKSKADLPDKRAVLEAVRRYHPDKNMAFGDEWHVLAEEITKCLNNCFGRLKSL